MNHLKGYRSVAEAMRSKAYQAPGAVIEDDCRVCDLVHVRKATEVRAPRKPRARKDTGPSRAVRKLVMERDGNCCAGCLKRVPGTGFSVQHRNARGMGGTSRADVNSPVNLVLLCGSATSPGGCHLACEQRDPVMHKRGLWLYSWEDPALVPVVITTASGPALAWPLVDGTYSDAPPAVAA